MYTRDDLDRIVSATGMGFTWDDNGNLVTWDDGSDDWAYRYDSENRHIKVKVNGAAAARYTYDAGGRRVRGWDAVGGTVDYVYSGLNIVDEINGGAHEKYVYAGSMHLASNSSGTTEYFHVDHLGSTRLKTTSTGGVIYESNYEPFGPGYGEDGSEEFRYTGKQEDTTGLYYFGARYYDPVTGRFITRDSVFGDLSDPQSLNRYVYCRNNPHKYTDPDGRISIQLGAGSSAGFFGFGGTLNVGIVATLDWSGFELGIYREQGVGLYFGLGVSGGFEIGGSIYSTTIYDIEEKSVKYEVELASGPRVGGGLSFPREDNGAVDYSKPTLSINIPLLGAGYEASYSQMYTKGYVTPIITWDFSPIWDWLEIQREQRKIIYYSDQYEESNFD
jgi:RHS repeat-associated protein